MNMTLLREFLMTSANKDKLSQADRSSMLQAIDAFKEAKGNRKEKAGKYKFYRKYILETFVMFNISSVVALVSVCINCSAFKELKEPLYRILSVIFFRGRHDGTTHPRCR